MKKDREYYQLSQGQLLEKLNTSLEEGLNSRDVKDRQREFGYNTLPETINRGIVSIILDQFQDFMIVVLISATVLSILLGEISDALTIFTIILLNALMGFIQEYRAEKSLSALKNLATPGARVLRGGMIREIAADQLVPGDILLLKAGDRVAADARLVAAEGIQVDESFLTGESVSIDKSPEVLYTSDLEPARQKNMLFMGSTLTRGQGRAIVVGTGQSTEMGRIACLLSNNQQRLTPLQQRLKHLGKWLILISIILTILIVIIGVVRGQSIYQMFMAGVSLAVAAIPEGLPAIVTLALALGVQRMIRRKAIVRKLPAVETLGCATVICADKTGTLTQNKMSLKKVYLDREIQSFNPDFSSGSLRFMLTIGALCNQARLRQEEKQGPLQKIKQIFGGNQTPDMIGDPTDIAFLKGLYEYGLSLKQLYRDYQIRAVAPFDAARKRMSVLVKTGDDGQELFVKGAPETILDRCQYLEINGIKQKMTGEQKNKILSASNEMAREALRVIALAYRPVSGNYRGEKLSGQEQRLVFVGLAGLIDPLRPEVQRAVDSCRRAGIRPIMITGDHRVTAGVIARQLGIIDNFNQVITGDKLQGIDDKGLIEITDRYNVYARISPELKLRLVRALKNSGEVVAMTGDGVNDAPAVKEADIGVAMGVKGTDVTREVASLVLGDDNFATIVEAVKEGRVIYNNIRKFIRYLLACNIGELLAILLGVVMGLPLPLLPIQILWVNLVTDGLPALALGLETDDGDVMSIPPRPPDESIFARGMVGRILSQGLLIGISTMIIFLLTLYCLNLDLNIARTMAFSTLVFSQLIFVFSCRSETEYFWRIPLFSNVYLLLAVFLSLGMQLAVIYLPVLASLFQTGVLNSNHWLIVAAFSCWPTVLLDLFAKGTTLVK
ncbi:MAG: calcium-translocating P-type ATPase, PMCA-type [Bacillota bacterium]